MNGVLVIDKPQGPTSFDIVRGLRSALKVKKVGHTGTLDPMATGVLPVCLGDATKVAGFITEGDKAYEAVVRLGEETDTQDATGAVVARGVVPSLTPEAVEGALAQFRGPLLQLPPMYSAVKVAGKRLYELARAGEEVARSARPVVVHELNLRDLSALELRLSVRCSKGFFVRTLAHDLGRVLGCGAHLKALRRTASGPFSIAQALSLEKALAWATSVEGRRHLEQNLVSMGEALGELPALTVSEADAVRVSHGLPLEAHGQGRVRVLGPGGELLAVAEIERGRLCYRRVLV